MATSALGARSGQIFITNIDDSDSPYTVPSTPTGHNEISCDTDGGPIAVTLPAGENGKSFCRIHNTGTSGNAVTLTGNGGEQVVAESSQAVYDGETLFLIFTDNNDWW